MSRIEAPFSRVDPKYVAAASAEVTRNPSPDRFSSLDIDTSIEAKRGRGKRMLTLLSGREEFLKNCLLASSAINAKDIVNRIECGQGSGAVDWQHAWPDDIVGDILDGRPVRVITGYFNAISEKDPETRAEDTEEYFIPTNIDDEDQVGIQITRLFTNIANTIAPNVQPTIIVCDAKDPHTGMDFSKSAGDLYILDRAEKFKEAGIIADETVLGDGLHVIQQSNRISQLPTLIEALMNSNGGEIRQDEQGVISFIPTPELVDLAALHDQKTIHDFKRYGIFLADEQGDAFLGGGIDALSILDLMGKSTNEEEPVSLISFETLHPDDGRYLLLRALEKTKQHLYHTIIFNGADYGFYYRNPQLLSDDSSANEELYSLSDRRELEVVARLKKETEKYLADLDKYTDWKEFDPKEYVWRNYHNNGEILPEDQELITHWIKVVAALDIPVGNVVNIGTGPNLYPIMLLEQFADPDKKQKIKLFEYVPANREYMQHTLNGDFSGEDSEHATIWHKFEDFMVEEGGDTYRGAEERAKQKAEVNPGDVFNLPRINADLVTMEFVSESIVSRRKAHCEVIKCVVDVGADDVTIVSMHMLSSEGYPAGEGTHFPAVALQPHELVEAYRDAGMADVQVFVTGEADQTPRDGYHGMAMVVARRKRKDFVLVA